MSFNIDWQRYTSTLIGRTPADSTRGLATYLTNDGDTSIPITFGDTGAIDAFGRLRVSQPETLFETQMQYNAAPLFWDSILAGSGSATHLPNEAAVRMRTTTASGDSVIRQTKRYIRYQPGKSQQILMTFVMGAAAANVRKRVGYFDAQNGIFLEQTGSGLSFVRRSFVSATADDFQFAQSDWNLDPLNGNGPSGISLNMALSQILIIDIEWLGVGRVRAGFVVDGGIYYAHEFLNTNVLSTVYMTTANLPLRYEITNTDTAASATNDMYQICASVSSEGGRQERNVTFGYTMTASRSVTNAALPLLSIRPSTVFPGGGTLTNRSTIIPLNLSIYTEDAAIAYWWILNGTLTGASFADYNTTHSGAQIDVAATAISGGVQIDGGGYVVSTNTARSAVSDALASDLGLTLNAAGTVGDILTLVCLRLTNTSSDTWAALTWKELY